MRARSTTRAAYILLHLAGPTAGGEGILGPLMEQSDRNAGGEHRRDLLECRIEENSEAVLLHVSGEVDLLPASRTIRFAAFAEDWLRRAAGRNLAPKTFESYEGAIRNYLVPAFGSKHLGAITRRDVELFLAEARTARRNPSPVSPKTAAHLLTLLKAVLADALEHGHLARSPASSVRPPRRADRGDEMHALAPGEVARLLDATEEPWRTLYLLAAVTGLRRGELLGLRWGDVDLARGHVQVRRSLHRIRDGDRYVVREAPAQDPALPAQRRSLPQCGGCAPGPSVQRP